MIIEKKEQHEIIGDDFLTIESSVNKNKLAKLYGMLSDIYRNPIGSIVREYSSNGYDANKEAYNFANLTFEQICNKYSWVKDPKFNLDESKFLELQSNLNKASDKEPIIVGVDDSGNTPVFYVKDFGIGLSPERMKHIYFNYLDSTKEENDDEIGGLTCRLN